jgi:hypothetical protein
LHSICDATLAWASHAGDPVSAKGQPALRLGRILIDQQTLNQLAGVVIPQPPQTTLHDGEAASTVSRRGCILWRIFAKRVAVATDLLEGFSIQRDHVERRGQPFRTPAV